MPHTDELNRKSEQENGQGNKPPWWAYALVAAIILGCIYLSVLIVTLE